MSNQYATIRPASQKDDEFEEEIGPALSSSGRVLVKRRRIGVLVACEACRTKKIRCDGQRPRCANCASKEGPCNYRDNVPVLGRESRETLLEAVRLLNARSPRDALRVLAAIRNEPDASVIMATLRNAGGASGSHAAIVAVAASAQDSSSASDLDMHQSNTLQPLPGVDPGVNPGILNEALHNSLDADAGATGPTFNPDALSFDEYAVDNSGWAGEHEEGEEEEEDDDDEEVGSTEFEAMLRRSSAGFLFPEDHDFG